MKHLKHINEIFGIRNLFNEDEKTAQGILKSMIQLNPIIIKAEIPSDFGFTYVFSFRVDDFDIKVDPRQRPGLCDDIYVDDLKLKCSSYIGKKIYKKCIEICEKPKKDEESFLRKDAKINFNKYK